VTFAGDAALRLQGPRIVCHMEDLGEPWPTRWRPSHDDRAADAAGAGDTAASDTAEGGAPADRSEGRGTDEP
jgi:hypothetical protein